MLSEHGSAKFYLLQSGNLFPGNTDGTTPDVSGSGFYGPRGMFHFTGSVTVGGMTFTNVDLFFVADTENNRVLVYDGKPEGLTVQLLRDLYGVGEDDDDEEFSTAITSTSISTATDEDNKEESSEAVGL